LLFICYPFCDSVLKAGVSDLNAVVLQAYAAEAGAERAEEPMEEAGMSDEIIQKASIVHCSQK